MESPKRAEALGSVLRNRTGLGVIDTMRCGACATVALRPCGRRASRPATPPLGAPCAPPPPPFADPLHNPLRRPHRLPVALPGAGSLCRAPDHQLPAALCPDIGSVCQPLAVEGLKPQFECALCHGCVAARVGDTRAGPCLESEAAADSNASGRACPERDGRDEASEPSGATLSC